ncbi:MAG: L-lactate dehydrogenase [Clostridiaceae bacterium]|nr:L-lactate dehydrogenase [Clostridiaceae bacterium]
MKNKVVIIGCGNVGMSYAYALLNQKTNVGELILIDLDKERIEGEVMDLNHCLAFGPSKIDIRVGDYSDCSDAKMVVIAAGANQAPGETRMDLINKNSKIFKEIVKSVVDNGFDGIFLVATNPLDVMTYLTWKYSGFNPNRVLGTGTSLDTSRLRYLVGNKLNINPKNVHAYVVGEHGDSEFVPWSNANVGIQNIDNFLEEQDLIDIEKEVKNAAYEIINRKGATCYGIGMCLVRITNAILGDENTILTVSSYDKENNIFMGIPSVVNCDGVKQRIYIELTDEEINKLQHSVDIIKDAIKKIDN